MNEDYKNKMDILNTKSKQYKEELAALRIDIEAAITAKDFSLVQNLIKKQTEIIAKQNAEMLSVM